MMKLFFRLTAVLLLGFTVSSLAYAGEVVLNQGKTGVEITTNTYQDLSFVSHVSLFQFREVDTKQGLFTELFVPGLGYSEHVGDPNLPVNRKLIEIPVGATVTVEILNTEFTDIPMDINGMSYRIIPRQAPLSKEITDPALIPFVINEATYQKNAFLGSPLISVTPVGTMRAINLARLDIAPVQYNPVTGTLRIYETIEVRIHFTNGSEQATISRKQELFSPWFDQIYSQVANFKSLSDELITENAVTYIIVSDPMFEDALQPFINWKTRKGFKVVEAYTDDPAVGNTTTSIKDYLQDFYTTPPTGYNPQSFVLFVGDVAQIPAYTGTAGNHPTDLYYCEYSGDKIPECYYGRFSANNLVQLQPQIDKTLEYEQYAFPDEAFLGEVVMSAGADASHQLTWGNGQINYGTEYYFNSAHGILSHTYLQPEPPGGNYSALIQQNVSDGVAYANYTAHCSESGWADPSFQISDISDLENVSEYCLMVGNCCLSNRYNTTCFGEEQLRAADKGALGYIGGSNNTYWDEDFWWGVGLENISANPVYNPDHLGAYDVTFHDHGEAMEDWYVTQGQMVVGGNLAVEQSNSGMKTYYWEIYCLMGDPSLMVYMSVPPVMTAVFPDVVMMGTTTMDVETEPYAYIGLSRNGDTYITSACADANGDATLTFPALTVPEYLGIVITKQNFKPVIDSIQVIPAVGPYLSLAAFTVNDSIGGNNNHLADFSETITVSLQVSNIGVETAYNVTATLTTTDTNLVVTNGTCVIDSVPPGGITVVPDAFAFTINNYVEDQHVAACAILFNDGTDNWSSTLLLTLNAPVLVVNAIEVIDPLPGGNNNGILDPGENAILRIKTKNTGHAMAGNGVGHLTAQPGSNPYIIVNTPVTFIGNFPINTNVSVDFPVVTNGVTPVGTVVSLDFLETAGLQNQFMAQKTFDVEIGAVPAILMQTGTTNTCSAKFYDTGGPDFNYGNSENLILTFFPSTPGTKLLVDFTQFDVEPSTNCAYDYLSIYMGNTTLAPLIGKFCGTTSPGTIQSTASDGSLTFKFHSDYSDPYPGWEAIIHCSGGPLTLMASAFPPIVCEGSSTILSAMPAGGSGTYTYLWEPATYLDDPTSQFPICTPAANITYTVTVSDGTSTLTSEAVAVTLAPVPAAPVATLNGDLLESSAADGNQWYFNGASIPGATSPTYEPQLTGIYYVTTTAQPSGCESDPSNSVYFVISAIDQGSAEKMVHIYPNPFTDVLTISWILPETSPVTITISDAFGRTVRTLANQQLTSPGNQSIRYESAGLLPGIYFCRIQTDHYTVIRKVILTR